MVENLCIPDLERTDHKFTERFGNTPRTANTPLKKEQVQYIKTHKPKSISFKFEIKRFEIFENGTAIVSGTGTIHRKDDPVSTISFTNHQMSSSKE
jgi:hypothetical protein